MKIIKGHWTEASAYKALSAWLRLSTSQQAHIDVIIAQNDAMAMGARKAFHELHATNARDRWLKLPYLGCDGVPKTGQAWVKSGWLAATVVIPPLAGQALGMLISALQTGANPPDLTLVAPSSLPSPGVAGQDASIRGQRLSKRHFSQETSSPLEVLSSETKRRPTGHPSTGN
jgi:ribose transport system substrate-binding protein